MPFMHRNRRELSIIATALIFCSLLLTPARAEYNPKLGRFMQRDPNETAMLLTTALIKNAESFGILSSLRATGQYSDGMHLYQYLQGNPLNRTDPAGTMTLLEFLTKAGIAALIATALVAAFGAGRGAVGAMGMASDGTPRSIAAAMVQGAGKALSTWETWAAIAILSAVIATGPIGVGIVGAIGIGAGMLGYVNAQSHIAEAQSFEDLYVATYDGVVSTVVIAAGWKAAKYGWTNYVRPPNAATVIKTASVRELPNNPRSLTQAAKKLQSHADRPGGQARWGKCPGKVHEKDAWAMGHLMAILKGPGKWVREYMPKGKWNALVKRLPDGRGLAVEEETSSFITFMDPSIK